MDRYSFHCAIVRTATMIGRRLDKTCSIVWEESLSEAMVVAAMVEGWQARCLDQGWMVHVDSVG